MKIKEYKDLPTINSTTETYEVQKSLSLFDIPFIEENNKDVLFETVMEKSDGYRGAWIQRIIFKGEAVGITYQSGRSGNDGYGYFVLVPNLFKEMIESLHISTRGCFDEDEDVFKDNSEDEFNEIYGYDIRQELTPVSLRTSLKVGDIIDLSISDIGESLEKEFFKSSCEVLSIDLTSDYKAIEVKATDLRCKPLYFRSDYFEIRNRAYFSTVINKDDEFNIPEKDSNGKDWNDTQKETLRKEMDKVRHPSYFVSLSELQAQGIDISEV